VALEVVLFSFIKPVRTLMVTYQRPEGR